MTRPHAGKRSSSISVANWAKSTNILRFEWDLKSQNISSPKSSKSKVFTIFFHEISMPSSKTSFSGKLFFGQSSLRCELCSLKKSRLFSKWSRLQCHLKLSWANDCYRSCCDMFPAELGVGDIFLLPNSLKMVNNKRVEHHQFYYRLFIKTFFNSHSFPLLKSSLVRNGWGHQIKRFCTSGCNQSEWSHLPVNPCEINHNKIISWKLKFRPQKSLERVGVSNNL